MLVKHKPLSFLLQQSLIIFLVFLPSYILAIACLIWLELSTYLVLFAAISLLLITLFLIGHNYFKSTRRVQVLTNVIESLIEGDYNMRARIEEHLDFEDLIKLINKLSSTLDLQQRKVNQSQILLETIVNRMDMLVIGVDANGDVVLSNEKFRKEFKIELNAKVSLHSLHLESIQSLTSEPLISIVLEGQPQEFMVMVDQFVFEDHFCTLYLLTPAERYLREKERQSWQSLLRVLSHEINNSLAPISSISNSLLKRFQSQQIDGASFEEGLSIIQRRSTNLSKFIGAYSQLAYLPKPSLQSFGLHDFLSRIQPLFGDRTIQLQGDDSICLYADISQLEQVVINILKNADEAMQNKKHEPIIIEWKSESDFTEIKIIDSGPGVSNPQNLFVPFYTTKNQGSGIGLALSRQIMLNHSGSFNLENRSDSEGAQAVLKIPNKRGVDHQAS